ncbi:MAG: DUF6273 domain-containing protein, partial [Turicibacter sp.]|nr:DUF6273 domain-containing protein [Turicibacter sp.]
LSEFNSTNRRIKRYIIKKTHKWLFAGEPVKREKFQEYVPRQSEKITEVAEVAEVPNVAEAAEITKVTEVAEVPNVAEATRVAEVEEVPVEPPQSKSKSVAPKPPTQKSKISAKVGEKIPFSGYDWRVLDIQNNQALLLSELVLEKRPYNDKQTDITWENCTLRDYLNKDFYNKLSDKGRIVQSTIKNDNNPWFDTSGGNNTTDNIFLLSIEEVVKYLGDGNLTRPKMSENEKQFWESRDWMKGGAPDWFKKRGYPGYSMGIDWDGNSKRVAKDTSGAAAWWWLRSPGYFTDGAARVFEDGDVYVDGYSVSASGGVRPALWLNLQS